MELVNWCAYYHNLLTAPDDERPPMDIFDKDVLLDEWVEYREFRRKNAGKSSIKDADSHQDSFEAF